MSTFEPQAIDAALQLTEYFGIRPGDPSSEIGVEDLLDTEGLRRASALRVISTIYEAWSGQTDGEPFQRKSRLYQQLFEKARQRCHLTIDLVPTVWLTLPEWAARSGWCVIDRGKDPRCTRCWMDKLSLTSRS